MSNINLTVEALNKIQPLNIVGNELVRQRFIQIYNTLWGEGTGEVAYERESIYFNRILADNEKLQKATPFSIFTTFIDLAVCGLSLETGTRALCYLQGRNSKIGVDANGKNVYEGRLTLSISGYGELVLRARCGQILHADNPVMVYEEDEFSFADLDGKKSVSYVCHYPHKSNHIVACYLRITRTDGTIDYSVMYEEDWLRLQNFSAKNNKRWDTNSRQWIEQPNELYVTNEGRIDSGFLSAKCIKHAFKSYPKVRIGKATELETTKEETPIDDLYGVAEEKPAMPKEQTPPFGNTSDISAGAIINPSSSETEDDGAF